MRLSVLSSRHLFCVIFMFVSEKNPYIKDLNALRILMNFLCIYIGEKGGGVALMHVYVREHIVSLYYRTALWMFTILGRDEVPLVPYECVVIFWPDPSRGGSRAGQK